MIRRWLLRWLDRDGMIAERDALCLEYERCAERAVAERNRYVARLRELGELV